MERWVDQVAFVSGASSGIGKAIAVQLVEHGLKVVGFARRQKLLDEIAVELSSKKGKCNVLEVVKCGRKQKPLDESSKKGKFYPYAGDASKEEDILSALQWTRTNVGPVSIIVNNAAVLNPVKLTVSETKLWQQELDINVLAVCIATTEAIKQMKENNINGHVININSIAGHNIFGTAIMNLYSGTKHAVTAFTETLRLELANEESKIKITSLSPGAVRTDMLSTATGAVTDYDINSFQPLETSDIANAVLYVLGTPPSVNISEITIQGVGEPA